MEVNRVRAHPRRRSSFAALFAALLGLSLLGSPSPVLAQLTVTGQVTDEEQASIAGAQVVVRTADAGTVTDARGRYRLVIPESRLTGASAQIRAQALGYRGASSTIQLEPGEITENFVLSFDPLLVEEVVATGQGLEMRREALGATVNSVSAEDLTATQESNIVSALTGKAPNVQVFTSSGDPGAGAFIRIRGSSSLLGAQPLFIVDGVPISNASVDVDAAQQGTVEPNRAIDLNPEDVESVEILKGPAAAIYGSRAAQGVVLITTKRGTPGDTRVTLKTSITRDEVTQLQGLQRTHGRGLGGGPFGQPGVNLAPGLFTSWGPALDPGTPTFDHAGEVYRIGHTYDTDLQISGGSESTTYFLSVSRLEQNGVIVGNSEYDKTTVRLKGTHNIASDLSIAGNISYAESGGDFIQKGNTTSGIQLGALRTPPEFDNLPYLDPETGLHRSFRCNPESCRGPFTDPNTSRGYDNPFWVAFEMPNTSEVQRVYGNVEVEYQPLPWLDLTYTLGSDFWSDDRRALWPKSSSTFPQGKLIRAELDEWIVDSNLLATVSGDVTEDISGSLTIGQNLNHQEFERYQVDAFNQITGTDQLDFSIDREPDEFGSEVRTDGVFAQANVELWDQLFVNGGVRGDKASTFGEEERFWYTNGSVAWEFTAH
ncbi:MAG: TonB-dependent receptor plug domain-containing protein, partial [Gemmatimonadota bacterium]|nr:TonB-dependent receptor plug domain-containing protein [Gemmatimonadota bacterium]